MKLTEAQARILAIIDATGFMHGVNPARTLNVLVRLGLVVYIQGRTQCTDKQFATTEAGKAWLAAHNVQSSAA
jgi:hypothetical protein